MLKTKRSKILPRIMAFLLVFTLVGSSFTSTLFAAELEGNNSTTISTNEPGDPGGDNESSVNTEEDLSKEGGVVTNEGEEEEREDQDNLEKPDQTPDIPDNICDDEDCDGIDCNSNNVNVVEDDEDIDCDCDEDCEEDCDCEKAVFQSVVGAAIALDMSGWSPESIIEHAIRNAVREYTTNTVLGITVPASHMETSNDVFVINLTELLRDIPGYPEIRLTGAVLVDPPGVNLNGDFRNVLLYATEPITFFSAPGARHFTTHQVANWQQGARLILSGPITLDGGGISGGVSVSIFNSGISDGSGIRGQGNWTPVIPRGTAMSGITFKNIVAPSQEFHIYLGNIYVSAIFSQGTVGLYSMDGMTRFENIPTSGIVSSASTITHHWPNVGHVVTTNGGRVPTWATVRPGALIAAGNPIKGGAIVVPPPTQTPDPIRVYVDHFEINANDDRINRISTGLAFVTTLTHPNSSVAVNANTHQLPEDEINFDGLDFVRWDNGTTPNQFIVRFYNEDTLLATRPAGVNVVFGSYNAVGSSVSFGVFPPGTTRIVIDALWRVAVTPADPIPVYVEHFEIEYGTSSNPNRLGQIDTRFGQVGSAWQQSAASHRVTVTANAARNNPASFTGFEFVRWDDAATVRFYNENTLVGTAPLTPANNNTTAVSPNLNVPASQNFIMDFDNFPTGVTHIVIQALWQRVRVETEVVTTTKIPVYVDHFEVAFGNSSQRLRDGDPINGSRFFVGELTRISTQKYVNGVADGEPVVTYVLDDVSINALTNFHPAYNNNFNTPDGRLEFVQWEPAVYVRFYGAGNVIVNPNPISSASFSNTVLTIPGHDVVFSAYPMNVEYIVIDALWSIEPTHPAIPVYIDHFQIDADYSRIDVNPRISTGFAFAGELATDNTIKVEANTFLSADAGNFGARGVEFVKWYSPANERHNEFVVRFFDEDDNLLGNNPPYVTLDTANIRNKDKTFTFNKIPTGTAYIVIDVLWRAPATPNPINVYVDHFEINAAGNRIAVNPRISEGFFLVGNLVHSGNYSVLVNAMNNRRPMDLPNFTGRSVQFVQWDDRTTPNVDIVRFFDENDNLLDGSSVNVTFGSPLTAGSLVTFDAVPAGTDYVVIDALWRNTPQVPSINVHVDHFQIDANGNRIAVDPRISTSFTWVGAFSAALSNNPPSVSLNAVVNRLGIDLPRFIERNVGFVQWDNSFASNFHVVRLFTENWVPIGGDPISVSFANHNSSETFITFGALPEGTAHIVIDALWRVAPTPPGPEPEVPGEETPPPTTPPTTTPPTTTTPPPGPSEEPPPSVPTPVPFTPGLPSPSAPFTPPDAVDDEPAPPLFAPAPPNFPQEEEDDEPGPPLPAPGPPAFGAPNPQTGDDQSFAGFIASAAGLALSMAALLFVLIAKRKK